MQVFFCMCLAFSTITVNFFKKSTKAWPNFTGTVLREQFFFLWSSEPIKLGAAGGEVGWQVWVWNKLRKVSELEWLLIMKPDYSAQNAKFSLELRWKTPITSFTMTPALRFLSLYCRTRFPHPDLIWNIHAHPFPIMEKWRDEGLNAAFLWDCVGCFCWNVGLLTRDAESRCDEQDSGLCPGARRWLKYLLWKVASVNVKWLIHHGTVILYRVTLSGQKGPLRKPEWGFHWPLGFSHSLTISLHTHWLCTFHTHWTPCAFHNHWLWAFHTHWTSCAFHTHWLCTLHIHWTRCAFHTHNCEPSHSLTVHLPHSWLCTFTPTTVCLQTH